MSPHVRFGLLLIGVCVVVGGGLAGAAAYSDLLPAAFGAQGEGPAQRIVLPEAVRDRLAAAPSPSPTQTETADEARKAEPETEQTPALAPQLLPGSVFRLDSRGSLACRIPGGSDFLVEWDAPKSAAVAHFSGVKVPGTLTRQRIAESNTLKNRIAISREEGGHRLALTIDDSGAMRASVDGQDSMGSCNPT